jgi:streptomycin 6-kinase
MFQVPTALGWMQKLPAGRRWLSELPACVERCTRKWKLLLDQPYPQSFVSVVFPARRPNGSAAVLKIQYPHEESENEPEALRLWNGNGAVKLFDYDAQDHALLMERCFPGEHLSNTGSQEALNVFADLLPRLWIPAGATFKSLAEEASDWLVRLPAEFNAAGKPFESALLDAALAAIAELRSNQGEQVLLNQDLHGDNVLRAQRQPWLCIDPKPLVGERELSVAPIIRGYEFGHSRDDVLHRLNWLSSELNLDRERARLWALAQTLAWGFEGTAVYDKHVETARWLMQA